MVVVKLTTMMLTTVVQMESFALAWKLHATKHGEKNNPLTTRRKGTASRDSHRFLDSAK